LLFEKAEQLIERKQANIPSQVEQVEMQLRPGTSPYRDLINWWQRLENLHIGREPDEEALTLASKRDDKHMDAWLYELWIALEFAHFLHQEHALHIDAAVVEVNRLQFTFTWQNRNLRFCYNRQREESAGRAAGWENAPPVRPDYTIERVDGDKLVIRDEKTGRVIWSEPPVMLDAKYYTTGDSVATLTHEPIKKLLADMAQLYARQVVLFFPWLPNASADGSFFDTVQPSSERHHAGWQQEFQIHRCILTPKLDNVNNVAKLQASLEVVLDHAARHLPERGKPTCGGVWLDPDSINTNSTILTDYNILCPKPHIGKYVFDLVHSEKHCLKDPRLCHVIGQVGISPAQIVRVTTSDSLAQWSTALRTQSEQALRQAEEAGDEARFEELRESAFNRVGRAFEQYVSLRGNTSAIEEHFSRWIFSGDWKEGRRCLAESSSEF
jgi:hypothetical protein